jgi:hypothetical protein
MRGASVLREKDAMRSTVGLEGEGVGLDSTADRKIGD